MQTLASYIEQNLITMTCSPADHNPHMEDADRRMHHWRCVVESAGHRLTVYFSQGSGLTDKPTVEDVLSCLADDAASFENAESFEDWASEYGYDTDSRKAERIYNTVKTQSGKLRRFLGLQYDALLWEVERQ